MDPIINKIRVEIVLKMDPFASDKERYFSSQALEKLNLLLNREPTRFSIFSCRKSENKHHLIFPEGKDLYFFTEMA